MDVLENAKATALGSVAKAKIKIRDTRAKRQSDLSEADMPKASGGNGFSVPGVDPGALLDNLPSVPGIFNSDGYNREMTVQFNPSSLSIRSVGGDDDVQITNYTQDANGVSRGAVGLYVEFSVKLIFDQISNTAAFAQDMLTVSSSRAISSVTGAIGDALFGGSQQSVQMIVESFIAAMRNESTRFICFEWGEFMYEGMLSRVNTAYKMFDINGNPIRAEVELVIYLVDQEVMSNKYTEYWYDAYYNAFIAGNPAAMAMMELAEAGLA